MKCESSLLLTNRFLSFLQKEKKKPDFFSFLFGLESYKEGIRVYKATASLLLLLLVCKPVMDLKKMHVGSCVVLSLLVFEFLWSGTLIQSFWSSLYQFPLQWNISSSSNMVILIPPFFLYLFQLSSST